MVADTSDEESNLPDDPIDMDEDMMLPQKPMVRHVYNNLPRRTHGVKHAVQIYDVDGGSAADAGERAGEQGNEKGKESQSPGQRPPSCYATPNLTHVPSGLPPPDLNAISVASLDSDDEKIAHELSFMVCFFHDVLALVSYNRTMLSPLSIHPSIYSVST